MSNSREWLQEYSKKHGELVYECHEHAVSPGVRWFSYSCIFKERLECGDWVTLEGHSDKKPKKKEAQEIAASMVKDQISLRKYGGNTTRPGYSTKPSINASMNASMNRMSHMNGASSSGGVHQHHGMTYVSRGAPPQPSTSSMPSMASMASMASMPSMPYSRGGYGAAGQQPQMLRQFAPNGYQQNSVAATLQQQQSINYQPSMQQFPQTQPPANKLSRLDEKVALLAEEYNRIKQNKGEKEANHWANRFLEEDKELHEYITSNGAHIKSIWAKEAQQPAGAREVKIEPREVKIEPKEGNINEAQHGGMAAAQAIPSSSNDEVRKRKAAGGGSDGSDSEEPIGSIREVEAAKLNLPAKRTRRRSNRPHLSNAGAVVVMDLDNDFQLCKTWLQAIKSHMEDNLDSHGISRLILYVSPFNDLYSELLPSFAEVRKYNYSVSQDDEVAGITQLSFDIGALLPVLTNKARFQGLILISGHPFGKVLVDMVTARKIDAAFCKQTTDVVKKLGILLQITSKR
eukprot:CAMPEP_0197471366 /NCGR_PEP_ID=MMETSP1309-20131121/2306_1 /TAXON_ID=464262 /ORGANISM="Genus nov. species nov., Strain RCC998" /LENGTH=515 /DNA_ID=CAMNT_0043009053 /DNA_START=133 /DNA_END=1680 /DNA_ORIENTATION=-